MQHRARKGGHIAVLLRHRLCIPYSSRRPRQQRLELQMMKIATLAILASMTAVPAAEATSITLFQGTSLNVAGITPIRDDFRTAVGGGIVAGANGSFGGVRREINWDGVPDAFAAPNSLPANFFNVNSPRGVVYSTPGTGFQVSANSVPGPIDFGNINPTYTTNFEPFSAQRLFTSLGSTITDVNFFLPGTATPAVTSAFGVIFSDVDMPGSTMEFFDSLNNSLGVFAVPFIAGNGTFSFLGLKFDAPIVGRVRITSGNTALGPSEGGSIDVVVMDDFIYGEPTTPAAVPEPASLVLLGTGIAFAVRRKRR